MKKLINRPEDVLSEMIEGFLVLYPGLSRLSHHNVVLRSDADTVRDRQVAIISGGGSGHEPAHAGFVGPGMLSAAVAGEVFTSPSTDSVLAAIRAVTGRLGVLLIVKNYTGDRLNFGLAAEMARAEGFLVETVTVSDDVALTQSHAHAGRRGLAGTVLIHKIAGAAAAAGRDLPQVASIAQVAAGDLATMGIALSAGTSLHLDRPSFTLEDEVELGLGIHGEPGIRRIPMAQADVLTDELLRQILSNLRLSSGDRVAVLINNLGATTGMELAIVARRALAVLASRSLVVERLYAGTFLSSLEMAGVSISLLRLDDERLKWLDASTAAPAWPNVPRQSPASIEARTVDSADITQPISAHNPPQTSFGRKAERAIRAACDALVKARDRLTEMDQAVGDGDLGHNLARAAATIEQLLPALPLDHPPDLLRELGVKLQSVLGGSSGPLYGVLFLKAGNSLEGSAASDAKAWAMALVEGCEALSDLGGARLGDCTMLDALIPFARTFAEQVAAGVPVEDSLPLSLEAAEYGAARTSQMTARRGRSSYLRDRVIGHADPGAAAVVIWLGATIGELNR